jgi:hypothetical protein
MNALTARKKNGMVERGNIVDIDACHTRIGINNARMSIRDRNTPIVKEK